MGIFKLSLQEPEKIRNTSEFLLGPGREKLLPYYTLEELSKFYDPLCSDDFITSSFSLNSYVYIVSQTFGNRINGVIFGKKLEEHNARVISNIVVGEPKKGIGTVLIQRYEEEFPNIDFFIAQIREANIPSQRLFESQGYKHDGYADATNNIRMYYKDKVPFSI